MRLWLILVVSCLGCGGPSSRSLGGGPGATANSAPLSPLERDRPALRWVPADASYVLAAASASDAARAFGELAAVASITDEGAAVVAALRQLTGVDFTAPDELAAIGIAVEASAVVFATEQSPTAGFHLANRQALREFLDSRAATVSSLGSIELARVSAGPLEVSWAHTEQWVLVHVDVPGVEPAWATAVAAADSPGIAVTERFARAIAEVAPRQDELPDVLGMIDLSRLGEPCAAAVATATRGPAGIAIDEQGGALTVSLVAPLAPEAALALADAAPPPPPAGILALRQQVPMDVSLGIDLAWLEQQRRASACAQTLPALELGDTPRAAHIVIRSLAPRSLDGWLAAYVIARDPALISALLDEIPQRRLFERSDRIGEVAVRRLSVPLLPPVGYRLDGSTLLVGVGRGALDAALASGLAPARAGELELAAVQLQPQAIGNLEELIAEAASATGTYVDAAALARRLQRFRQLSASASVLDGRLFARLATKR